MTTRSPFVSVFAPICIQRVEPHVEGGSLVINVFFCHGATVDHVPVQDGVAYFCEAFIGSLSPVERDTLVAAATAAAMTCDREVRKIAQIENLSLADAAARYFTLRAERAAALRARDFTASA